MCALSLLMRCWLFDSGWLDLCPFSGFYWLMWMSCLLARFTLSWIGCAIVSLTNNAKNSFSCRWLQSARLIQIQAMGLILVPHSWCHELWGCLNTTMPHYLVKGKVARKWPLAMVWKSPTKFRGCPFKGWWSQGIWFDGIPLRSAQIWCSMTKFAEVEWLNK